MPVYCPYCKMFVKSEESDSEIWCMQCNCAIPETAITQDTKDLIKQLHQIKAEMNRTIRKINTIPGLEIHVEIMETKIDGQPHGTITGLEISVKQEVYP